MKLYDDDDNNNRSQRDTKNDWKSRDRKEKRKK